MFGNVGIFLGFSRFPNFLPLLNCVFQKKKNTSNLYLFPLLCFLLLTRHEIAAAVCRQDGGVIVAHADHALRGSIPIHKLVFECISIPLGW